MFPPPPPSSRSTGEFAERFRPVFGRYYELDQRIGSGGMADVYRASDLRHGRKVAIKLLRSGVAQHVGVERFLREIRIAAQLQHPNILPVHDSGEADGLLFYIMPYVDGDSLRARLRASPTGALTLAEALRVVAEVGDALAYAHARGVVHRDVKPENILFSAGHAMVADFGIALAVERPGVPAGTDASSNRLTEEGMGLGTIAYMSPEQAFGDETLDARTDIYSLGCVLHEMLVGEPPFVERTPLKALMRKLHETPPRLTERPGVAVPKAVDDALARALAREPEDRFATVAEFLAALRPAPADVVSIDALTVQVAVGALAPAAAPHASAAATPSIAVLPLVNLSADPENDFLSDGLTEELIHALAALPQLRVVGRTSAFAFKGKTDDVREIGRRLEVASLLEGSVRRHGQRLRITARLIDAATGFERWSERYDRELRDVFEVQDEITRAIVSALRLRLLHPDAPLVGTTTQNVAAYERYLQARFHWNGRTVAGLHRSVELLDEALALDPEFAPAHAALAESHVTLAVYGAVAPHDAMPRARAAADDALARDPRRAEALAARACVTALYDWQWADAEGDFREAIAAPRPAPTAWQWYATNLLVPLGRFDEARRHLAHARELDPLSPAIALSDATTHFYARDYDRAAAAFAAQVERDPHFGMARYFLGLTELERGHAAAAVDALREAATLAGDSAEIAAALGVARARAGDPAAARSALARLDERARHQYTSPVLVAQLHLALGDRSAALDALDRARDVRATELAWLGVRPAFDAVRGDARFEEIVGGVGLR